MNIQKNIQNIILTATLFVCMQPVSVKAAVNPYAVWGSFAAASLSGLIFIKNGISSIGYIPTLVTSPALIPTSTAAFGWYDGISVFEIFKLIGEGHEPARNAFIKSNVFLTALFLTMAGGLHFLGGSENGSSSITTGFESASTSYTEKD